MANMLLIALICAVAVQVTRSCKMTDPKLTMWAKERVQTLGNCTVLSAGLNPVDYEVPGVKIFLYQRDEDELIADFLQYNSYLFGISNIVVIDNDSQHESICKTLALFQHCGAEIVTTDSMVTKGKTLSEEMRKHNDTLLIPLDTDEMIFPFVNNSTSGATVDRDLLWKAFKKLPIDGRKYKFSLYNEAHPPRSTCVASRANVDNGKEFRRVLENRAYFKLFKAIPRSKTFFHSDGFLATDDGNHYGSVRRDHGHRNMDPLVVNNMTHYFAELDAQMVHFSMGSYRAARNKYLLAASVGNLNSATDCSVQRVNSHYCVPAKLFVNGTDRGEKFYLTSCAVPATAYTSTEIGEWFSKHTLSLVQLLGIEKVL